MERIGIRLEKYHVRLKTEILKNGQSSKSVLTDLLHTEKSRMNKTEVLIWAQIRTVIS
jgi:hypothetical protein